MFSVLTRPGFTLTVSTSFATGDSTQRIRLLVMIFPILVVAGPIIAEQPLRHPRGNPHSKGVPLSAHELPVEPALGGAVQFECLIDAPFRGCRTPDESEMN